MLAHRTTRSRPMVRCYQTKWLVTSDVPLFASIHAIILIGVIFGVINASFVTGMRIASFIVTLATLFIGRGFALYLSETRMVFQSDTVQTLGRSSFLGLPWAIWIAASVAARLGSPSPRRPLGDGSTRSGWTRTPRPRRESASRRSYSRYSASTAPAQPSAH